MLTILAIIAATTWIVGALVIIWATRIVRDTTNMRENNLGIILTMAFFWPLWVVLGTASAFYEIHRTNKLNRPTKPIDRNTRG